MSSAVATVKFLNQTYKKEIKSSEKDTTLNVSNGKCISGLSCIAKYIQRTHPEFQDLALEDRMLVEQWLEYRHLISTNTQDLESQNEILKELNNFLKDKVYFVADRLTLADVLLYHSLHEIFKKVTYQEKEQYLHLSRWLNNVQQDKRIRQSLVPIKFLRTLIYDGFSNH